MLFEASVIAHAFGSDGTLDADELFVLQEFIENEKKVLKLKRKSIYKM
jgi:hypothetical protein